MERCLATAVALGIDPCSLSSLVEASGLDVAMLQRVTRRIREDGVAIARRRGRQSIRSEESLQALRARLPAEFPQLRELRPVE